MKKKLGQFTDNSKYMRMITNRPNPAIIPHPNRRLLAEVLGLRTFALAAAAAYLGTILLLQVREQLSLKLYNKRKVF
jgi:hypothetical protein